MAKNTLRVQYEGTTIDLDTCWPQERIDAVTKGWPDGVIDVSAIEAGRSLNPDASSAAERKQLVADVKRFLGSKRRGGGTIVDDGGDA